MEEQLPFKQNVTGPTPVGSTKCGCHPVARMSGFQPEHTGSSPVTRTLKTEHGGVSREYQDSLCRVGCEKQGGFCN